MKLFSSARFAHHCPDVDTQVLHISAFLLIEG